MTGVLNYDLSFGAGDLPPGLLRPIRVLANEAVSIPYRFEIEVMGDAGELPIEALVGGHGEVIVTELGSGEVRRFGGLVTEVRQRLQRSQGSQRASIVLEHPALVALANTVDWRIFQELTTQQIVAEVLAGAGVAAEHVSFRLDGSYTPRVVCTQLGETGLAFMTRLFEEDGIFYFFEHLEGTTTLVVADSPSKFRAHPNHVPYIPESGLLSQEALTGLDQRQKLRPKKVSLRSHDFKRPSDALEVSAEADTAFGREWYVYSGRYETKEAGAVQAQKRLEAEVAHADVLIAKGHVPSLGAGQKFELFDTPRGAFDREWAVLAISQRFFQSADGTTRFESRLSLAPADRPYAPPLRAPRVRARPHAAVVTGPAGEEIHCDEFGRVKVQFLWDRYGQNDDKSSAWVRVGQMHSSGAVAIPRIGWRVLVDFENGDPDLPVVIGRLYDGRSGPPTPLPDNKTVSSLMSFSTPGAGGFNMIQMNDSAGAEGIQIQAQKDLNVVVDNDRAEEVTNYSTTGVKVDETIKVGVNQTVDIGECDELTVGGSQTYSVGAARTKSVTGDEKVDVKGSRSTTIGAAHILTTPQAVTTTTSGDLTETAGGACIEATPMAYDLGIKGATSIVVGGVKLDAVGGPRGDVVVGARAQTVGGAMISAAAGDLSQSAGAAASFTVGGPWLGAAGQNFELSTPKNLTIKVGGALALTGTKIVLKVGGSSVTIAAGAVVLDSKKVKLAGSGPTAELAAMVGSK